MLITTNIIRFDYFPDNRTVRSKCVSVAERIFKIILKMLTLFPRKIDLFAQRHFVDSVREGVLHGKEQANVRDKQTEKAKRGQTLDFLTQFR